MAMMMPARSDRNEARPRALDLFCCGGGAGRGLSNAGFDVHGVDIEDTSRYYPFHFQQGDVLELDPAWIATFDFVWASPPCQAWTLGAMAAGTSGDHPKLIAPVRDMLAAAGVPFAIENVPTAPLRRDALLCGQSFGLPLIRHRVVECHGFAPPLVLHATHVRPWFSVAGGSGGVEKVRADGRIRPAAGGMAEWKRAMGIDWLPRRLLVEAVPPAYSEAVGRAALAQLTAVA